MDNSDTNSEVAGAARSLPPAFSKTILWIEVWAEQLARSPVVLAGFTLLYFLCTCKIAANKLLWDDELYTLYISKADGLGGILQALGTGADQHPPGFYYLTNLILSVVPSSHITVRLPSIFGFWLFCICLYWIMRRIGDPVWGVLAMLFPMLTTVYYYATEARGYGLVLGCVSLALLSWMLAADGVKRKLLLPLLAVSLAAAVSSHYYALLALGSLCAGEAVRTKIQRKIDWPVWLAFTAAFLPLTLFFPTLLSARNYSVRFWAVPIFLDVAGYYGAFFGWLSNIGVGALVIALVFRWTGLPPSRLEKSKGRITPWCLTALGGLLALPLLTMTVALLVTHAYTDRYAIAGMVGSLILFTYFLRRMAAARSVVAVAIGMLFVVCFAIRLPQLLVFHRTSAIDLAEEVSMFRRTGGLPVVISETTAFHRVSFYAPRELASRVAYVSDPQASMKHVGFDTVDRGLLALRPWFPHNIVPPDAYLRKTPTFLVYGSLGVWSLFPHQFNMTDLVGNVIARRKEYLLYLVNNRTAVSGLTQPLYPESRAGLFAKIPHSAPSLCELYLSKNDCLTIRK